MSVGKPCAHFTHCLREVMNGADGYRCLQTQVVAAPHMNCGGVRVLIKERVQRAGFTESEIGGLKNLMNCVDTVGELAEVLHVGAATIDGVDDFAWCREVVIGNIEVGTVSPMREDGIVDIAGSVGAAEAASNLEELVT